MKKRIIIPFITIAILLLSFFLFEPIITYTSGRTTLPNVSELNPIIKHKEEVSKKADSILKELFLKEITPGISAAVGLEGNVVWSNAIGYSDIENFKKIDLNTQFRVGSTSKAITSIGLGMLLQNNTLNLNTKVKEFVPYAPTSLSNLTVKQLASHTSGIRNYGVCFCFPIWEHLNNDEYKTVKQGISIFSNSDLLFSSGADFSYSTYNYTLLSAIIEGASGKDFLSYMQTSVFKPLGVTIKGETADLSSNNISKFYDIEENTYKETFQVSNSNKWAGGGFLATPIDLVKLGNSFLNNQLLNKETTKILIQPVFLTNGKINEQNYAIGWRNSYTNQIFNKNHKVQILHHAGVAVGSTSVFILFPEYNISVSILMNRSGTVSDLFEYSYKLAENFIAREPVIQ